MKAYTDLNQSKKLAKILPLESADMCWLKIYDENHMISDYRVELIPYRLYGGIGVPCWSFSALFGVLPKNLDIGRPVLATNYRGYYWVSYFDEYMKEKFTSKIYDNPVDACYEMVLKLHELKML